MNEKFPEYDSSVGGKISIDIVTKGCGKEQVAARIREAHPNDKLIFFGDRTEKGGNDYKLAETLRQMDNTEVVPVTTPDDVLTYLGI